jgi:hypothetical protein
MYCHAHTPSIANLTQHKISIRSTPSVVTTMKKEKKPYYLQTTNHNKNRKHNKCKMTTPFTPHDAQLSLVLGPSVNPKP